MSPPIWTAQQAASLKALREAAGLDVTVLAKRHNLSATQVRQLEDGGDGAFYTPQIKWAAGRKLTLALGGEWVEPAPAPDTAPTPQRPDPVAAGRPTQPSVAPRSTPPHRAPPVDTLRPHKRPLWPLPMGLLAVLLGALAWVRLSPSGDAPTPSAAPPQASGLPSPTPSPQTVPAPPATAASASTPETEGAPTAAPVSVKPMPTETSPRASDTQGVDECHWVAAPRDMTPVSGQRPDNYVHVVARQTTTVCWRDAEKKTRQQALQAQERVSFWGTPPFQVYTPHPGAVQVYFKGHLVRWPSGVPTPHIVLGTRSAQAD